jgi:D-alanine-D-alanine ligase
METVAGLQETLVALGYDAFLIGDGLELLHYIMEGRQVDLVFNISEGLRGRSREAQVPALLEMMGIPYTGADPLTLALCLDKGMFKRILKSEGIPTPDFHEIRSAAEIEDLEIRLPAFVKPAAEGSGKGIRSDSRVTSPSQLREVVRRTGETYGWPVLVEEFLPGVELTIGIIGNGEARCLGAMEIEFLRGSDGVYSYQTKKDYLKHVKYHVPPRLPQATIQEAREIALKTYHLIGGRDFGRVDLRLDAQGHPQILEINPLAGLNPVSSDLIIMAKAQGIGYETVIGDITEAAISRTGLERL